MHSMGKIAIVLAFMHVMNVLYGRCNYGHIWLYNIAKIIGGFLAVVVWWVGNY